MKGKAGIAAKRDVGHALCRIRIPGLFVLFE